MKREAVLVLDCGATNIRAIAIDRDDNILAKKAFPNQTQPDPYFENGLIWDVDHILNKLAEACRVVCSELEDVELLGVCTTSFGVDGAPFDKRGNQLYPVISWACERTESIMEEVHSRLSINELHSITGLNVFHFNTLYKLFWLKKFHVDIPGKTSHWLFLPSIISHSLCGRSFTDVSMLGTSFLCDRKTRGLSKEILSIFELNEDWFPGLKEAGEQLGVVSPNASGLTGIPAGTPIYASGHDTQFAILGSGAGVNEPVLSSGTWEVLMVRTPEVDVGDKTLSAGITTELDALPGLYNPGLQWMGSKHIEELRNKHFGELIHRSDVYEIMIDEAQKATSDRGKLFRSLLVELSKKTRESLHLLENVCNFKASSLIVVGGGSKNRLWNEIREEILGMEIRTIPQAETTAIGAARIIFENLKV